MEYKNGTEPTEEQADEKPVLSSQEALDLRREALASAFRALKDLLEVTKWREGRERIVQVIAEYHNCDTEGADYVIQAGLDAIAQYNEMNEALSNALVREIHG